LRVGIVLLGGGAGALALSGSATSTAPASASSQSAAAYWTPARRASAIPRDIVIDHRGLSYLRARDGSLRPHGHAVPFRITASVPAGALVPQSKGGGSSTGDKTPPTVTSPDPNNKDIGASYPFRANVTDLSGIRSVSFILTYPNGTTTQSFRATLLNSNTGLYGVDLSGFTAGNWTWRVRATDNAKNTGDSGPYPFTVNTGGGGGGGGDGTIAEGEWTAPESAVTKASGRLLYEMPANRKQTRWVAYLCSGTVATDGADDRSIVLTAAHCVYDDVNKAFARNVIFIPNQAGTTGTGTDRDCANDPIGCWAPKFGVVDSRWASGTWPDNRKWDYGYYVVPTSGHHTPGTTEASPSLELAAGTLRESFANPNTESLLTHAFGYSGSKDPSFRYCAENLGTLSNEPDNWWLGSCGLTGGSSGGAWLKPFSGGSGTIVSVNSWGYTNSAGMAGPKFNGSSASCVRDWALRADTTTGGTTAIGCSP
jgi:hypothetical protein